MTGWTSSASSRYWAWQSVFLKLMDGRDFIPVILKYRYQYRSWIRLKFYYLKSWNCVILGMQSSVGQGFCSLDSLRWTQTNVIVRAVISHQGKEIKMFDFVKCFWNWMKRTPHYQVPVAKNPFNYHRPSFEWFVISEATVLIELMYFSRWTLHIQRIRLCSTV